MKNGGKREGAGVKEGSVRPKITSYWNEDDISDYFDYLKKNYKKSDTLTKFVGEQLMGKAIQPLGNDDDKPFIVKIDAKEYIDKIYGKDGTDSV